MAEDDKQRQNEGKGPATAEPADEAPVSDAAPEEAGGEKELMRELDRVQGELEEMKGRYLRSVADLENFRKRMARERQDILRAAAAAVIEELLPALDHMAIGLEAAAKHPEAGEVTEGFRMVHEQLKQALAGQGLEELRPDGEPFDPNLHECISHQPSDDVEEGRVTTTVRSGYRLHDRLLRAANVVVSSGPADGEHDASGI